MRCQSVKGIISQLFSVGKNAVTSVYNRNKLMHPLIVCQCKNNNV